MIFYDWNKILRYSNGSYLEIVKVTEYITYKPIPNHYRDDEWRYSQIDWSGTSYLLNPVELLRQRYGNKVSNQEIAQYIWLASLRSYPEYQTLGRASLDLLACIGKEDIINKNSLLYIEDYRLFFKYEEATKENA